MCNRHVDALRDVPKAQTCGASVSLTKFYRTSQIVNVFWNNANKMNANTREFIYRHGAAPLYAEGGHEGKATGWDMVHWCCGVRSGRGTGGDR